MKRTFSTYVYLVCGLGYPKSNAYATWLLPPYQNPWKQETKFAYLTTLNQGVQSGYSLSYKIQNSKTALGILGKTDPYEPLNTIAFHRFYLRHTCPKQTWIIGSYRMQLGEGMLKSIGNPSYLSNPAWANKTEDWTLKEYRGFSRNFPVVGFATKINLSKQNQIICSLGKANLHGKIENGVITTWNKSGLFTDSLKLSQKNNFHCITSTTAFRYHHNFLTLGIALSNYTFSIPIELSRSLPTQRPNWYSYNSLGLENITTIQNHGKSFTYTHIWLSRTAGNGSLYFLDFTNQQSNVLSRNKKSRIPRNFSKQHAIATAEFQQDIAGVAGVIVPLNKFKDIAFRYQYIGLHFESFENLDVNQNKGIQVISASMQNQFSNQKRGILSFFLRNPTKNHAFENYSWEKSMRLNYQCQLHQVQIKSTLKISQASLVFQDETPYQYLENTLLGIDDADIQLMSKLQQPQTIQTHIELLKRHNSFTTSEFHLYGQTNSENTSMGLELTFQKQWHSSVTSQSGFALFNCQSPLMIQGLQLGSVNNFQLVTDQGYLVFLGLRNKVDSKLTQILQLQIMQNFTKNGQITARIFAVIWLR